MVVSRVALSLGFGLLLLGRAGGAADAAVAQQAGQGSAARPDKAGQQAGQGSAAQPGQSAPPVEDQEHEDVTGRRLRAADFANAIEIPGTSFGFRFGGYIKLDFIQDLDFVGNREQFQTSTIPPSDSPLAALGGATTIIAKESRFNFDVRSPTPVGEFRAFIEGDFYGDGNAFRMRHAYGVLGHFLGGQTWTTFMDISAMPLTIDFEGPDAQMFVRQAMVRWEQPLAEGLDWAIAAEDPNPQISNPSQIEGEARSSIPDLVTRVRYDMGSAQFQLAGLARQLRFVAVDGWDATTMGWGLSLTGRWQFFGDYNLSGQVALGRGIGRYVNGVSGFDADAVVAPDGQIAGIPIWGIDLGYEHYWRDDLRSVVTMSVVQLDNHPGEPPTALRRLRSPHFNLFWSPWELVLIGGEVMWGERINKDGSRGDATRIQFAVKFKFPSG